MNAAEMALDRALAYAERQQPPWAPCSILKMAEELRGFLESEHTTEPLHDRLTSLEVAVYQLESTVSVLKERTHTLEAGKSTPAPKPDKKTPTPQPDVDVKVPDPIPVDF